MSPELMAPENFNSNGRPTKASDCYALGMVIFEVLSGETPFSPHSNPLIMKKVLDGERPERPRGEGGALFTDTIWEISELCWKHEPGERTNAKAVLRCLEGASSLQIWSKTHNQQEEKEQKELERKKEGEARERGEEFEVRCDSCLF